MRPVFFDGLARHNMLGSVIGRGVSRAVPFQPIVVPKAGNCPPIVVKWAGFCVGKQVGNILVCYAG